MEITFFTFCHFTINLHLIIKVKIRNMARKTKRNQGPVVRKPINLIQD